MNPEYIRPGYEQSKARLLEEMGEVIVAFSKIDRFGEFSHSPFDPKKVPNVQHLYNELMDLEHAFNCFYHDFINRYGDDIEVNS